MATQLQIKYDKCTFKLTNSILSSLQRNKLKENQPKTIKVMKCLLVIVQTFPPTLRQVECFGKSSVQLLFFSKLIGIVK